MSDVISIYLNNLSSNDILEACSDIYDYKYKDGFLKPDSIIRKFANDLNVTPREICDSIEMFVAMNKKYIKTIKLIMMEHPVSVIDIR